jgi:alkanesulfonate monooxygenase SsuD/methylene tetrahydromethanopterin reductase-like flavin-dependent oxidoreductase (luciferase family)
VAVGAGVGAASAPARGPGGQQPRAATSAERSLVGTPEQILKRLRDYVPTGVTEMCVIFYSADPAAVERQTRLFASEVMARW